MKNFETVVLGGGLAGLGASLTSPGPVLVLESEKILGGLCRTESTKGYHFDLTGHVLHLRRKVEGPLIRRLLKGKLTHRRRKASIYMHGKMIPYPFQTHFSALGPRIAKKCLSDLRKARRRYPEGGNTRNFELWSRTQFGNEIADMFMLPYNKKLFRIEPKNMSPSWRGVFIPRPSMAEVLRAAREGELQGQGYNAVFMYPKKGGISVLPNLLAKKAGKRRGVRLMNKSRVVRVNSKERWIKTADGREFGYKHLISTLALPEFLKLVDQIPRIVSAASRRLRCVGVVNFNLGFKGQPWPGTHWVYFPESKFSFYRIGFPSRFSHGAAPKGTTSCYLEVSFRPESPPDLAELRARVIRELIQLGLIRKRSDLDVCLTRVIRYAYVVFDHHREKALGTIKNFLDGKGITLAGRYGEWNYGSMEDAVASGREAGISANKMKSKNRF